MGSISKKFKKNIQPNFYIYVKFICYNCGSTKLFSESEFLKITNETFKNNKIFFCKRCNTKMTPVSIEADY